MSWDFYEMHKLSYDIQKHVRKEFESIELVKVRIQNLCIFIGNKKNKLKKGERNAENI